MLGSLLGMLIITAALLLLVGLCANAVFRW